MLLFLSDLHLADSTARSTIDLASLFHALDSSLKQAAERRVEAAKLVLLGDIFEILKSKTWLASGLRPWETPTPAHGEVTRRILAATLQANERFLEGLSGLRARYSFLEILYLPGNHDLPLNTAMGEQARETLAAALLLPGGRQPYDSVFTDREHSVIARHGHEWDPTNRYGDKTAAFGDFIVIDLVLRLPLLVSAALSLDEEDPSLTFLHELDNVRPQQPYYMARWLMSGLSRLEVRHPGARKALRDALALLSGDLRQASALKRFASVAQGPLGRLGPGVWWRRALMQIANSMAKSGMALEVSVHLPRGGEGPGPTRHEARYDLSGTQGYQYILCGHTHLHELVPLDMRDGRPAPLYINTGTWRRTHRMAEFSPRRRPASFSTWQEECLVCIYSPDDQKLGYPPFEIRRFTRGQIF